MSKLPTQAGNKAKIVPDIPLKTSLSKHENHSTNDAFKLVESRDTHRQAVCVTTHKGSLAKTMYVPHFNRDTVEFASRERDESKPGIKTLLPFLKNITGKGDLENFEDLLQALDTCYLLQKVISISLSRFGDDRRCDFSRF